MLISPTPSLAYLINSPIVWDLISSSYPLSNNDIQHYWAFLNPIQLAHNPHLSENTISSLLANGHISGRALAARLDLSPQFISVWSSHLDHPTLRQSGYQF